MSALAKMLLKNSKSVLIMLVWIALGIIVFCFAMIMPAWMILSYLYSAQMI